MACLRKVNPRYSNSTIPAYRNIEAIVSSKASIVAIAKAAENA
jgi:hypothetical protein